MLITLGSVTHGTYRFHGERGMHVEIRLHREMVFHAAPSCGWSTKKTSLICKMNRRIIGTYKYKEIIKAYDWLISSLAKFISQANSYLRGVNGPALVK